MQKFKRALVTGAAGFLGSHLSDRLIAAGFQVVGVDNFVSGSVENINPKVEFHYQDISKRGTFEHLFEGVDVVFHCAAIARTPWTIEDPYLSHESTATGTLNVLDAARRAGVQRFVHSSSCIVYVPNTPYYVAKQCAEEYVRIYRELYGLSTVALRYSNIYGSRQSERGPSPNVFAALRKSKKETGKIVLTGDGEQTRDYTHVSDIVEANMKAMESDEGGAYYVGTSIATSLNEAAEYFNCPIEYTQDRPGDIKDLVLPSSEFRNKFGWRHKMKLSEGIKDVL